jgi:hypothetical protein
VSVFCRHNRFTADCPICSKGTVLDPDRKPARRPRPATGGRRKDGARRAARAAQATTVSRGPFTSAGPYPDGHEVRLERVPGGLRFAAWQAGQILRAAPELELSDLPGMLGGAAEKGLLGNGLPREDLGQGEGAPVGAFGASPGRSGELRDELRVERLDGDRLRIARWILRPNAGWELQEAPVLLPPDRFAQALSAAAEKGVLASGAGAAE